MSVENFLDTNVIVYMLDTTDDAKRLRAEHLVRRGIEAGTACISYQVVQETLNAVTRRLGFSAGEARTLLADVLEPLWLVNPSRELYERGLELHGRYGFSLYDSMIVAGAVEAGCVRLYSEDLQHGQRLESLTIENPFIS